MDSVKEYNKALEEAKRRAAKLLKDLSQIQLMEVASNIKVSFSTIMLYKAGNGQSLETAVKIIDHLKTD